MQALSISFTVQRQKPKMLAYCFTAGIGCGAYMCGPQHALPPVITLDTLCDKVALDGGIIVFTKKVVTL